MNETVSLLLSVCAVLVVVGGLLAVGAFLFLRFLSRRTRGMRRGTFGALGSALVGDNAESANAPVPARGRRANLRDLAASVDFDAALARQDDSNPASNISAQQVQPGPPDLKRGATGSGRVLRSGHSAPSNTPASGRPADQGPGQGFQRVGGDTSFPDLDTPPDRPSRRRQRRGDANEDELFGGMLDEDGDGDVDLGF